MKGTEKKAGYQFPKDVIKLKITQELIVGHEKYDTLSWECGLEECKEE